MSFWDYLFIGSLVVLLGIFAYIIHAVTKKANKVIYEADRFLENLDDVDSDLMEVRHQLAELSSLLDDIAVKLGDDEDCEAEDK